MELPVESSTCTNELLRAMRAKCGAKLAIAHIERFVVYINVSSQYKLCMFLQPFWASMLFICCCINRVKSVFNGYLMWWATSKNSFVLFLKVLWFHAHNFEAIMDSGYSISLFTNWQNHQAWEIWIKKRVDQNGAQHGIQKKIQTIHLIDN